MKSSIGFIFSEGVGRYPGGLLWKSYLFWFILLILCFVSLRCPYVYGMSGFSVLVLFFVMPLYCGELFKSMSKDMLLFFASFVPVGTPFWVIPLVCLAETVSFVFRPFVLVLRPVVNLSIGVIGSGFVAASCIKFSIWLIICLFFLFLYEVAIFVIHSFIVWYLIEVTCKW